MSWRVFLIYSMNYDFLIHGNFKTVCTKKFFRGTVKDFKKTIFYYKKISFSSTFSSSLCCKVIVFTITADFRIALCKIVWFDSRVHTIKYSVYCYRAQLWGCVGKLGVQTVISVSGLNFSLDLLVVESKRCSK